MKSFYEMLELMEQNSQASVEKFPQDFEQVLNFVAGGPWSFVQNKYSPFTSMDRDNLTHEWVFFVRAEYRGMSEGGRHYRLAVRLNGVPPEPVNRNGADLMQRWKREFVSYSTKGSSYDERAKLPSVYFELEEIAELGPDTDGRRPSPREEEDATPEQRNIQTLIGRLKKLQDEMEKDYPRPKWTPERGVYRRKTWTLRLLSDDQSPKNTRLVDLARQIKDEIAKHEKKHPSFHAGRVPNYS